jgi:branched-chain amino acid transport system ATP-binding protein
VLLVEHNVEFVLRVCERVIVLNFGAQIAAGTPGEIRSNSAVIEAYLGKRH